MRVELPQDVTGSEPTADAEDHRLGQRLAGVRGDDPEIGQHVRERGRVAVEPTPELPGRIGADDVPYWLEIFAAWEPGEDPIAELLAEGS